MIELPPYPVHEFNPSDVFNKMSGMRDRCGTCGLGKGSPQHTTVETEPPYYQRVIVQHISKLCRCARHWPRGRHLKGEGPCLVKKCQCPYGKPVA